MDFVTKLRVGEDIALVTFNKIENDFTKVANVFEEFSKKKIDIDMISQAAPQGDTVSISFTMNDSDIGKVFEIIKTLSVKPLVSTGNCKIQLYGEEMPGHSGIASRAFSAVAKAGCQVMMITTSEVDISLLVTKEHFTDAVNALESEFNISSK